VKVTTADVSATLLRLSISAAIPAQVGFVIGLHGFVERGVDRALELSDSHRSARLRRRGGLRLGLLWWGSAAGAAVVRLAGAERAPNLPQEFHWLAPL